MRITLLLAFPNPWQMVKAEDRLRALALDPVQVPVPASLNIPCAYGLEILAEKSQIEMIRELCMPSYIYETGDIERIGP